MLNALSRGAALCVWSAWSVFAWAGETVPPTPTTLEGVTVIDTDEFLALSSSPNALILDVRSSFNYGKGHIAGAYSFEYPLNYQRDPLQIKGEGKLDPQRLPEDKGRPIIFYSHGPTGWKSYLAAKEMAGLGYTKVYWYRGGIMEWTDAGQTLKPLTTGERGVTYGGQ